MDRPFDRVAASLYLQEAYELVDALLFRLDRLDAAAARWLAAHAISDEQLRTNPDEFDVEAFNSALRQSGREQTTIFDEVEAFLAAWARLSLLFWPAPSRSARYRAFTIARGECLTQVPRPRKYGSSAQGPRTTKCMDAHGRAIRPGLAGAAPRKSSAVCPHDSSRECRQAFCSRARRRVAHRSLSKRRRGGSRRATQTSTRSTAGLAGPAAERLSKAIRRTSGACWLVVRAARHL